LNLRNFELEKYFSKWEFSAKHHMTASDMESMSLSELLTMSSPDDRADFENLHLGYTETLGAADLREHIAETYDTLSACNILCFAGAGEGIYAAMRVLLDKNDHAIVVVPNYQSAETIPLEICQVSGVALRLENNWRLDINDVEAALRPNTRLISINFPHNPTGSLMFPEDLDALVTLCRKHDLYLFSDEVYRGIELNPRDRMPQIADIYEKGFSLNVLSKAYGLPGLRIGWIASHDKKMIQRIERYKHYLSICNSGPSERLAVIALKNRDIILERNCTIVRSNIQDLDIFFADYSMLFDWIHPQGGCVAFPKYTGSDGVEQFCRSLIEESGVLLLPSSIYKSELCQTPKDHFRIGFGRVDIFKEGLKMMRTHIENKYSIYL
jgi:aspartate/methionine/tyrosine aminotransferase